MHMLRRTAFFLVAALGFSPVLFANPSIQSIKGNFGPNEVIKISGAGFGHDGPQIILFEDFEDVKPGDTIPLSSPIIGEWSASSHNPIAFDLGRSGNRSLMTGGGAARQLQLSTPEYHTNIFVSYWVRLAPNTYFPGSNWPNGRHLETFPEDSAWKYAWLMEDNGHRHDDGKFDVAIVTYTGSSAHQHQSWSGNAARFSNRWIGSGWFNWNNWMRMSFTMRDPRDFPESPIGLTHIVSEGKNPLIVQHSSVDRIVTDAGYPRVNQLNVPGWVKNSGAEDVNPLYDDIYVAVGPGAAARVELADSITYEDARHIELLITEAWSDSHLEVSVPRAVALLSGRSWFLFVTDAEGNRNASGIPIEVCSECPVSPDPIMVE